MNCTVDSLRWPLRTLMASLTCIHSLMRCFCGSVRPNRFSCSSRLTCAAISSWKQSTLHDADSTQSAWQKYPRRSKSSLQLNRSTHLPSKSKAFDKVNYKRPPMKRTQDCPKIVNWIKAFLHTVHCKSELIILTTLTGENQRGAMG